MKKEEQLGFAVTSQHLIRIFAFLTVFRSSALPWDRQWLNTSAAPWSPVAIRLILGNSQAGYKGE
jgi:hypothetical protein